MDEKAAFESIMNGGGDDLEGETVDDDGDGCEFPTACTLSPHPLSNVIVSLILFLFRRPVPSSPPTRSLLTPRPPRGRPSTIQWQPRLQHAVHAAVSRQRGTRLPCAPLIPRTPAAVTCKAFETTPAICLRYFLCPSLRHNPFSRIRIDSFGAIFTTSKSNFIPHSPSSPQIFPTPRHAHGQTQPTDDEGFVDGRSVRGVLMRSGLDTDTLGQIWMNVDTERRGKVPPRFYVLCPIPSD
jgi:hypothetical protein